MRHERTGPRPRRDMRQPLKPTRATGRSRPIMALAGAAYVAASLGASSSFAAQDEKKLQQIEKAHAETQAKAEALERKAKAIRSEVMALKVELISSAKQTQDMEERLTEIEDRLSALEQEEAKRRHEIQNQHGTLVGTLSALQRLAAQPPEALIARPGSPIDTVRSALLLSIAVPAIENRADYLRDEIQRIRHATVGDLRRAREPQIRQSGSAAEARPARQPDRSQAGPGTQRPGRGRRHAEEGPASRRRGRGHARSPGAIGA